MLVGITNFPLLDTFWTILWIFGFVIWIWLVIAIASDLFRDREQSGMAKALWVLFIVIVPLIGVLFYLIVRGDGMHARSVRQAQALDAEAQAYIRQAAGNITSVADELEKLVRLRDQGVISPEEFERQRARLVA